MAHEPLSGTTTYLPSDQIRMKAVIAISFNKQSLILATWTDKVIKQGATELEVGAWEAEIDVLGNAYPEELGMDIPEQLQPGVYIWCGDNKYPDDTFVRTGSLEDILAVWDGTWRQILPGELERLFTHGSPWEESNDDH